MNTIEPSSIDKFTAKPPENTLKDDSEKAELIRNKLYELYGDYDSLSSKIKISEPDTLFKIWYIITKIPSAISILIDLFNLIYRFKKMDNDKRTTYLASIKVILGILTLVLGLFKIELPAEIANSIGDVLSTVITLVTGSGYLVFSWLQGKYTNKK